MSGRRVAGARESRTDAAMVSVAALALSWQFLMGSYAHDASLSQFAKLVTMAYPVLDLGLLFIVVSALMNRAARRPADTLVAIALSLTLVSDFVYDLLVLHSSYTAGNLVDAGFLLNYVFMAAAAVHPSVATARRAADDQAGQRLSEHRWLPLVAIAAFVSPGILLIGSVAGWDVDADVLAATTIVLCALAVLRAYWLFGQLKEQAIALQERGDSLHASLAVQQALETDLRHQAFHDSLTGLANRALLSDRVEHALQASTRLNGNVAICFCDLDGFKGVNDSLGHHRRRPGSDQDEQAACVDRAARRHRGPTGWRRVRDPARERRGLRVGHLIGRADRLGAARARHYRRPGDLPIRERRHCLRRSRDDVGNVCSAKPMPRCMKRRRPARTSSPSSRPTCAHASSTGWR